MDPCPDPIYDPATYLFEIPLLSHGGVRQVYFTGDTIQPATEYSAWLPEMLQVVARPIEQVTTAVGRGIFGHEGADWIHIKRSLPRMVHLLGSQAHPELLPVWRRLYDHLLVTQVFYRDRHAVEDDKTITNLQGLIDDLKRLMPGIDAVEAPVEQEVTLGIESWSTWHLEALDLLIDAMKDETNNQRIVVFSQAIEALLQPHWQVRPSGTSFNPYAFSFLLAALGRMPKPTSARSDVAKEQRTLLSFDDATGCVELSHPGATRKPLRRLSGQGGKHIHKVAATLKLIQEELTQKPLLSKLLPSIHEALNDLEGHYRKLDTGVTGAAGNIQTARGYLPTVLPPPPVVPPLHALPDYPAGYEPPELNRLEQRAYPNYAQTWNWRLHRVCLLLHHSVYKSGTQPQRVAAYTAIRILLDDQCRRTLAVSENERRTLNHHRTYIGSEAALNIYATRLLCPTVLPLVRLVEPRAAAAAQDNADAGGDPAADAWPPLEAFDANSGALAAADANGGNAAAQPIHVELPDEGADDAGAAGANRVAKGNRAPKDVETF